MDDRLLLTKAIFYGAIAKPVHFSKLMLKMVHFFRLCKIGPLFFNPKKAGGPIPLRALDGVK
jgi:hypothetical protein